MKEQSSRIALCDLNIHDPDVVKAHHANDLVVAGLQDDLGERVYRQAAREARRIGSGLVPEYIPTSPASRCLAE
jgi:hypothetical protein